MMSGMRFDFDIARPRSGSGLMSSFGLKKSALPSKRCGKATGQLNIQSVSRKMFMTLGAVVATRINAGLDDALTMRCQQLSGIENIEPCCHSKTCGFFWSSGHISSVLGPPPPPPPLHALHELFVHVALGIERARARHLDHVEAPFAFRAVELDEAAVAAHPVPAL